MKNKAIPEPSEELIKNLTMLSDEIGLEDPMNKLTKESVKNSIEKKDSNYIPPSKSEQ